MKRRLSQRLLPVGSAIAGLLLAGCATSSEPDKLTPTTLSADATYPAALRHHMCVRSVTGGKETNPLWKAEIGDHEFHDALATSLQRAGLDAGGTACGYPVDAHLLGLSQPAAGFDMTVTSHVNYKVYDPAGAPFLLETISAPYTAPFSEAFVGIVRLKRANEGSIRSSIGQFLDKVRASAPK